jgi:hypothetical protein
MVDTRSRRDEALNRGNDARSRIDKTRSKEDEVWRRIAEAGAGWDVARSRVY